MEITQEDLVKLTDLILLKLKKEFEIKHLSKNLINTIEVETLNGEVLIRIPAKTYNMLTYQTQGVIVYTSHGSYASKLNEEGSSFYVYPNNSRKGSYKINPRNHKGYVERILKESLEEWQNLLKGKRISQLEGL